MLARRAAQVIISLAFIILVIEALSWSNPLSSVEDVWIIVMLMLFLSIVQRYPLPIQLGNVMLNVPILYLLTIVYGFLLTAIVLVTITVIVEMIERRPPRVYLFNAANFVLSLWAASFVAPFTLATNTYSFWEMVVFFTTFLVVYTIVNNLLVDLILFLRPQPYRFKMWLHKTKVELIGFCINYVYILMLHYFGSQERILDAFAVSFFFVPLVAISIISHIIVRLSQEKQKLVSLFEASQEMNESIEINDVIGGIEKAVKKVIGVTFGAIYIKHMSKLEMEKVFGYRVEDYHALYVMFANLMVEKVKETNKTELVSQYSISRIEQFDHISEEQKNTFAKISMLAVPLTVENDLVGIIVVGKERANSFFEADKTVLQTLANQASIAIKNSHLVKERERSILLEERNRLAREIHDGLAQSIAGANMQVDMCSRYFDEKPQEVKKWLSEILHTLRKSLKDIRQSIYQLKPSPTHALGLEKAIMKKVEEFQLSTNISCEVQVKGQPYTLPFTVEESVYHIVSEALQNVYKHAAATTVKIILHFKNDQLSVYVRDNGKGFLLAEVIQQNEGKHFGLLNMNELSTKHGAAFHVHSRPDKGTEIVVNIPLEDIQRENRRRRHA